MRGEFFNVEAKVEEPSADDVSDQMKFIRKVYGILACQLVFTAIMIAAVQYSEGFRLFCLTNPWLHILCTVIAIAAMCAIICCVGRTVPGNYIALAIFTIAEGYCVAGLTAAYPPDLVVTAGLATALVTISLTIYAFYTKTEMTVFMGLAFVVYLAMFPILLFGAFFMKMQALYIFYCCLGLILYSLFLIIDTMQIVRNNKSLGGYEVDYDDYVIGAMQLYLDIVMIFVYILALLGGSGGGD